MCLVLLIKLKKRITKEKNLVVSLASVVRQVFSFSTTGAAPAFEVVGVSIVPALAASE